MRFVLIRPLHALGGGGRRRRGRAGIRGVARHLRSRAGVAARRDRVREVRPARSVAHRANRLSRGVGRGAHAGGAAARRAPGRALRQRPAAVTGPATAASRNARVPLIRASAPRSGPPSASTAWRDARAPRARNLRSQIPAPPWCREDLMRRPQPCVRPASSTPEPPPACDVPRPGWSRESRCCFLRIPAAYIPRPGRRGKNGTLSS